MPAIGWDGRDVSGLSHEQIHRWTRDGASPEALAAARDRHLARADELRTAAGRLRGGAARGLRRTWAGADADAAGGRTRVLASQMERLAETVGGQARGIDGLRSALVRVQAAVGPPRPPALPGLGVTPVLDELRSLVTGRPADGYPGFRAAAADQAAAREAYRSYLAETATAARTVPTTGWRPRTPRPPRPPAPLPPGARGAPTGVLQRAAVASPSRRAGGPGRSRRRPGPVPGSRDGPAGRCPDDVGPPAARDRRSGRRGPPRRPGPCRASPAPGGPGRPGPRRSRCAPPGRSRRDGHAGGRLVAGPGPGHPARPRRRAPGDPAPDERLARHLLR